MEQEIHISDVRQYKQCRVAWFLSSPLRQNLEPRSPYVPFLLGEGVHEALRAYYARASTCEEAFVTWAIEALRAIEDSGVTLGDEKQQEIYDAFDLGRAMCWHYDIWAPDSDDFDVLQPEYEFQVPLLPGVVFAGRADGVARKRDGSVWLLEHKTAKYLTGLDVMSDEQGLAYLKAAQMSEDFPRPGDRPSGIIFTLLHKVVPEPPRKLQSGELSRAASTKCSAALYRYALEQEGLDSTAYHSILLSLEGEPRLVKRVPFKPSQKKLDYFWRNLQAMASEMLNPNTAVYPDPGYMGRNCFRCLYLEPCKMLREGVSPKPILREAFTKREGEKDERAED